MMAQKVYIGMKITRLILLLPAMLLATLSIRSQESGRINNEGFYVGTHAAVAIAESNFSSFGASKFYPGWNAGLNTGYLFTKTWSLELSASWSKVALEEQDCCLSRNYLLGSNLKRYHEQSIIPKDVTTQHYRNFMSQISVQRYGLQVNFNVLGLFKWMDTAPLRLELSPAIYAANTNASILTKASKTPVAKNISAWHLGYGGQLFTSYAITDNVYMGLYGAYTQYVGRPIDGLPRVHSTNYTVDAGVKLVVYFRNKKNTIAPETNATTSSNAAVSPANSQKPASQAPSSQKVTSQETSSQKASSQETSSQKITSKETTPNTQKSTEAAKKGQQEKVSTTPNKNNEQVVEEKESPATTSHKEEFSLETPYPIIYFSFNSIWIEPEQRAKVKEIAKALKSDNTTRIRIIGWGDEVGGNNANKRVSLQRAEAVKKKLEQLYISSDRIETIGAGIAPDGLTLGEGRIAIVQIIK